MFSPHITHISILNYNLRTHLDSLCAFAVCELCIGHSLYALKHFVNIQTPRCTHNLIDFSVVVRQFGECVHWKWLILTTTIYMHGRFDRFARFVLYFVLAFIIVSNLALFSSESKRNQGIKKANIVHTY